MVQMGKGGAFLPRKNYHDVVDRGKCSSQYRPPMEKTWSKFVN